MSTAIADKLLLLFDRPNEPIFTPKGNEKKIIQVPEEYLRGRYKELNSDDAVENRFGSSTSERIAVTPIRNPGLPLPESLKKEAKFSLFIPLHQEMANQVIEFLLDMKSEEDFWAAAVYFRANLNPQLFNYALSVAMLHSPKTQDADLYPLHSLFPDKFFDGEVLYRAREEVEITKEDANERKVIEINRNFSASDLDVEHRLAYFREDIGLNLHHWHWHLVYPVSPRNLADKDRRGELFFYMHQQIVARYNMERFCNHLPRVTRLTNFRDPIREAYFPKLTAQQSSQNWVGRGSNAVMQDISRPEDSLFLDIQQLERWRDRLFNAIDLGYVINREGEKVQLTEKNGIDILGNLVEASDLSINKPYYGNLHNMLHNAIAVIHDPDFRHLEAGSVMGDSATAMRDPVFYRVHMAVDDIFQTYKNTLPGYNVQELNFRNVIVNEVSVQVEGKDENQLFTFWKKSAANLTNGLDFTQRGAIYANFIHLQHRPFTYNIKVSNQGSERKGTVRIFIAPRFDERGEAMEYNDLRKFFVELDRFTVDLSNGTQTIKRKSEESSVTIPFERTYRDLGKQPSFGERLERFNFCGCGWPHNMLIAKGTEAGYSCQLFVMVSNFADDEVEDDDSSREECKDAMSYCGVRNKKYPDARAMGFPFDRKAREDVSTLDDFITPNMKVTNVQIFHVGNTIVS